jgi:hypothetical protein
MKRKNKKDMDRNTRLSLTQPNEFHLKNCQYGSTLTKNKKAYTRKEKYKKNYINEA